MSSREIGERAVLPSEIIVTNKTMINSQLRHRIVATSLQCGLF